MIIVYKFLLLVGFISHVPAKLHFLQKLEAQKTSIIQNEKILEEKWFMQFLDHFNPTETRIWQQRYYVNADHYKEGGPIFLMLGENDSINAVKLTNSFMIYLAQKFGALCFYLEHRFYGSSQPMADLSTNNLLYLSAEQALADAANFVQTMGSDEDTWIVFGNEYGGTLAAWLRLKYPHLVKGALADSAPLVANANFADYYSIIEKMYDKYSPTCSQVLGDALKEVFSSLFSSIGRIKLKKVFNLCSPISVNNMTSMDASSFFISFLEMSSLPALSNSQNGQSINITSMCDVLLDKHRGDILNRLSASFNLMLEAHNLSCLHLIDYEDRLTKVQTIKWVSDEYNDRQTLYQMCSQFGWFPNTSSRPFNVSGDSLPLKFLERMCEDVFGPDALSRMERGIERTNIIYGGSDITNGISRTIFAYGGNDPWKSFGIQKCYNTQVACIRIKDTGSNPLEYMPSENDTPQIFNAKQKVQGIFQKWLLK